MRCKACDAWLLEHTGRKLLDAGLCGECYQHSHKAALDYDHGLLTSVRPDDIHAATWEERYIRNNPPDSDT